MARAIDLTKEKNVVKQLESIINELLHAERNKTASQAFYEATKDLKPKSCSVKTGWVSGKYISFDCKCEKNGKSEVVKEIVKGMSKKVEDMYFIFGLNPDIFHFNPDFVVNEPDYLYFRFKLQKVI